MPRVISLTDAWFDIIAGSSRLRIDDRREGGGMTNTLRFFVAVSVLSVAYAIVQSNRRGPWVADCAIASVKHGAEASDALRRCGDLWVATGGYQ